MTKTDCLMLLILGLAMSFLFAGALINNGL